jgi:hypothetical protein
LKEVVVADFNTNCSSSVVSCWLLSWVLVLFVVKIVFMIYPSLI